MCDLKWFHKILSEENLRLKDNVDVYDKAYKATSSLLQKTRTEFSEENWELRKKLHLLKTFRNAVDTAFSNYDNWGNSETCLKEIEFAFKELEKKEKEAREK